MTSAPLWLAVVGCGDVAGYSAWFARLNRRIRLSVCCDTNEERAKEFARRHRIPRYCTEFAELLQGNERPDALYLAIPHHLHRPLTLDAINAGLPVLLEKPLALNADEGRKIVAAETRLHGTGSPGLLSTHAVLGVILHCCSQ